MTIAKPPEVREFGVSFMGMLVIAILADRKTVTRRFGASWGRRKPGDRLWVRELWRMPRALDHLSPREVGENAVSAGYSGPWAPVQYECDRAYNNAVPVDVLKYDWRGCRAWKGRPANPDEPFAWGRIRQARFMPRWASRINLEIVDVREDVPDWFDRLDEAEAFREGIPSIHKFRDGWRKLHGDPPYPPTFRIEFRRIVR